MPITFNSKIGHLTKLKTHYIYVTSDILNQFFEESDEHKLKQRFHITINYEVRWQEGTTSLGNNLAHIPLSKARMKIIDVQVNDHVSVSLEKDRSDYGFDVPEQFEAVLAKDPNGEKRFLSMSKGKRKAIIYMIIQIKSSEKRIDKSLFFIENLKRAPIGKETMRHLLVRFTLGILYIRPIFLNYESVS